jgi:hypothetical protein
MQPVCHWLTLEEICPDQWGDGYYQWQEVQSRMLNGGWCPSDLVRTVNKFKCLHTLHYLSFLDKGKPAKSHAHCTVSECLAKDLNATGESRNHWQDGCSCQEVEVDQEKIMSVLKAGNAVPLLVFKERQQQDVKPTEQEAKASSEKAPEMNIEVVSSTDSTPYVAVSHVSSVVVSIQEEESLMSTDLVRWSR